MRLIDLHREHRPALLALLARIEQFSAEEREVAVELIDEGLHPRGRPEDRYAFVVATDEGAAIGYACFGRTPLAEGVWDLYWIAVDPDRQGNGAGRAIMTEVERRIRAEGGRLLLVETASKPSYDATRAFYERIGYREAARVRDFYRRGDDKVIYEKRFFS